MRMQKKNNTMVILIPAFSYFAVPTPGMGVNKYPPAEPEVLRLLAPQRGLTAIG
jgi:hypothetical protein